MKFSRALSLFRLSHGEGDFLSIGNFKGVPVRVGQEGPVSDRIAGIGRSQTQTAGLLRLFTQSIDFLAGCTADAEMGKGQQGSVHPRRLDEDNHKGACPVTQPSDLCPIWIGPAVDNPHTGIGRIEGKAHLHVGDRKRDMRPPDIRHRGSPS